MCIKGYSNKETGSGFDEKLMPKFSWSFLGFIADFCGV